MARYSYRAVLANGASETGAIEAAGPAEVVAQLRRRGAMPVAIDPAPAERSAAVRAGRRDVVAATTFIGELAVLLGARLQLDRALALAIENAASPRAMVPFAELLRDVREGAPLSRAMAAQPGLFSATAVAMTEAGETNGRLDEALGRLHLMLEQAAELRRTVGTAMIYPIALLIIALAVVALMLLFVVPQFENVFATSAAKLPAASRFVMAASRFLRDDGLAILGGLLASGFAMRWVLRRPAGRLVVDRMVLRLPQFGELIRRVETARFARTLGALVDGNVALPNAFALAAKTIGNRTIAVALEAVGEGIRTGGGLTGPLAATKMLPRIAIGFFRTGEESSQLGPMLLRLADVLDRDIKVRVQRAIGIATPAITVILGATIGGIIASVLSAILGFNDLAVGP